jgi:hypothetical protein
MWAKDCKLFRENREQIAKSQKVAMMQAWGNPWKVQFSFYFI